MRKQITDSFVYSIEILKTINKIAIVDKIGFKQNNKIFYERFYWYP